MLEFLSNSFSENRVFLRRFLRFWEFQSKNRLFSKTSEISTFFHNSQGVACHTLKKFESFEILAKNVDFGQNL